MYGYYVQNFIEQIVNHTEKIVNLKYRLLTKFHLNAYYILGAINI